MQDLGNKEPQILTVKLRLHSLFFLALEEPSSGNLCSQFVSQYIAFALIRSGIASFALMAASGDNSTSYHPKERKEEARKT